MKKTLAVIALTMVAALALSLVGCGGNNSTTKDANGVETTKHTEFVSSYYNGDDLIVYYVVKSDDKDNLKFVNCEDFTLKANSNSYKNDVMRGARNGANSPEMKFDNEMESYGYHIAPGELLAGSDQQYACYAIFKIAPADFKDGVVYEMTLPCQPSNEIIRIPYSAVGDKLNVPKFDFFTGKKIS